MSGGSEDAQEKLGRVSRCAPPLATPGRGAQRSARLTPKNVDRRGGSNALPPAHIPEVEVCILAGGLSSRMGRDKATLLWKGRSFTAALKATAAALGLPSRIIARDHVPRCGPLGGLATGLMTTRKSHVLFLACDMPKINAEALRFVLGRKLVPARFVKHGRALGFPMLLARDHFSIVMQCIEAGSLSIQALAKTLGGETVRLPGRLHACLENVNTPDDYARLKKQPTRVLPRCGRGVVRRGAGLGFFKS